MITIYQKPSCTTCRQVYKVLKESGVNFKSVNYYIDSIPGKELKELLKKMGISARELLPTKEAIYKRLKLAEKELGDDELIAFMVQSPDLIQRPIVEKGDRAILARPAARIREIL